MKPETLSRASDLEFLKELVNEIKWKSIDKDNMEHEGTLVTSVFVLDRLRSILKIVVVNGSPVNGVEWLSTLQYTMKLIDEDYRSGDDWEHISMSVYKNKDGFWFFDETGSDALGPFATEEAAHTACRGYIKSL